jgi:glycerol-3-phosphate dehydrogenase subunit B
MPPAISGMRLRHVFEQHLPHLGVRLFAQQKVLRVLRRDHNRLELVIGFQQPSAVIHARGAILASGRFFGRGLKADRRAVRESIFNLPVLQPRDRAGWHNRSLFDPNGHAINRAGVETDEKFRPVSKKGHAVSPNLFAAGSILAHQDWVRMKCGSGLAITTAYSAVKHFARFCL